MTQACSEATAGPLIPILINLPPSEVGVTSSMTLHKLQPEINLGANVIRPLHSQDLALRISSKREFPFEYHFPRHRNYIFSIENSYGSVSIFRFFQMLNIKISFPKEGHFSFLIKNNRYMCACTTEKKQYCN